MWKRAIFFCWSDVDVGQEKEEQQQKQQRQQQERPGLHKTPPVRGL